MTDMTLEQVRDWHRKMSLAYGYWSDQRAHEKMADAIDSALKTRDELVAWRVANYPYGPFAFRKTQPSGWRIIQPLYLGPPTDDRPTWAEVREVIVRAVDWGYDEGFARANDEDAQAAPIDDKCNRIIAEFRRGEGK
jgi:hypothetical protein